MFPDCCNSARDSYACEGRAAAKCRTVDGNNRENTIIVADGVRNGHIAVIGIGAAGDDGMTSRFCPVMKVGSRMLTSRMAFLMNGFIVMLVDIT